MLQKLFETKGTMMIDKIIEIARQAGDIARDGFGKNFSIEYKSNITDLVTEIDKKSEKAIISYINKEFPEHSILAEESGERDKDSEYLWVIDPIDGTTNFAHGLPIFSISIGVQKNGETIAGVVYDVMSDAVFSAEKGSGAYRNDEKIKVSNNSDLKKSLLVTGFPYDIVNHMPGIVDKFSQFLTSARAVRRLGSAAIDFCYVASGVFDGFWEMKLNPWDVCAGMLIVEEAGGKITDFTGKKIDIYSKQFLASNGNVHKKMLEILEK